MRKVFKENKKPYFCWDRELTAGQIRSKLQDASGLEWVRLASWIMREASPGDVWAFLTPRDVDKHFEELAPFLHKRREFWQYLMGTWHELGRLKGADSVEEGFSEGILRPQSGE